MRLLIENTRIIDYKLNMTGDILINNGKISKIDEKINETVDKTINGKGLVTMPSFIDSHAHFREPGYTYKEDLETGSKAALRGGYTAVLLMGNTNPPASSKVVIERILSRSKDLNLIDILQAGTITEDLKGLTFEHLDEIKDLVKVITDDGYGVQNSKIMYDVMKYAKDNNLIVLSHAEDDNFTQSDMRLAENLMTFRDIEIAKITGGKLHFAHVSTKEAAERIIEEKKSFPNISFEVTPHHIFSYDETKYRVNPPFRKKSDRNYLIEAIRRGEVTCIGTDHAPHSIKDKEEGAPGISGVETAFQLVYTKLVKEEKMTLNTLSTIMSKNPAELLNFNKGKIQIGYDGDLVLIDENIEEEINTDNFVSKGKNNPFNGRKVKGKVVMTIKGGKIMYESRDGR